MLIEQIDYDRSRNAFDFLYMHRIVRSKSGEMSNLKNGEAEIAHWLDDHRNYVSYTHLERLLKSYGFELMRVTDSEMDGIPLGGVCFFIMKVADEDLSPWLTTQTLLDCVGLRGDSPPVKRRWAHFLWYMLLGLLYSRDNRPTSAVFDYNKAWFTRNELQSIAGDKIEEYRNSPLEGRPTSLDLLLSSADSKRIETRVGRFLKFLENIGYIARSRSNKEEFVQTLVMAKEIARNEKNGFSHIVNEEILKMMISPPI